MIIVAAVPGETATAMIHSRYHPGTDALRCRADDDSVGAAG
ncbi:hypothetical protein JOF56_009420 [Kibdelosporangium banguiense]|uniref:Uncharacterized protein n=1 Tax=Kibdelosporangium banguiense TaxID=1365924 RepID=A0ABS4TXA2_9PSEU|nr:hypothetical protein [Kibdelosporangium banguiense]MBP2329035.1 hypothetical protein [Kibdelosporangium banguiense]